MSHALTFLVVERALSMKRKEGAFWVVQALIVVGVLALVALPSQSTIEAGTSTLSTASTPTTSTTLGERSLVFASPVSDEGLQLRVVLNSSEIRANGTLGAQIGLYNMLDKNVSLSVTEEQQISTWNGGDFLCGWNPSGNLAGFALFEGDVTAANLSKAGPPLQLDPQLFPYIVIGCPTEESFPANVTFFPESNRISYAYAVAADVDVKTLGCAYTEQASQCTGTGLVGYWNDSVSTGGNLGFSSPAFVYFKPGEYTIVATDDWNQYVYATFSVVESPGTHPSSTASGAAELNTVVATVTVTETLATQASQATTTYALPATNCSYSPITWTVTSTFTVGPNSSVSTTTTTVTTTSTSYSRTVTVTSCTVGPPATVTSTITTTTTP
jgi:hypothetical protein